MIARKLSRPIAQIGKARVVMSAKLPNIFGRIATKQALDTLKSIGTLAPADALDRLRHLEKAQGELTQIIECVEATAHDLRSAADALSGLDIEDGGPAALTAISAASCLNFAKRLDPQGDFSAVADCIAALRSGETVLREQAEAARKRLAEVHKAMRHATESAIASPRSDPGAILSRFDCSPATQGMIDKALAEGAPDSKLRQIAAEAVASRVAASRVSKHSHQERTTRAIEAEAEQAWS